jgi:hypothetical protein
VGGDQVVDVGERKISERFVRAAHHRDAAQPVAAFLPGRFMYTAAIPCRRRVNTLNRIAIVLLLIATPAFANDARFIESLKKLDPQTRLEQACDLEAMRRISSSDRAKSDVISHPVHNGNTLTANGGAVRQNGKWYQLSFVCKATPDHLSVISFTHKVGALIPEEKWASYDLWQ